MNEERLRKALRDAPIHGGEEARERALRLARTAFAAAPRETRDRRPMRRHRIDVDVRMVWRTRAVKRQLGVEFAGVIQRADPEKGLITI